GSDVRSSDLDANGHDTDGGHHMRKGLKGLALGLGTALAAGALGLADASACDRHASHYGHYRHYGDDVPPVAYRHGPPPPYRPPPAAYGYGPPPAYAAPPAPGYHGAGRERPYGYGAAAGCGCDQGGYARDHAPPAAYEGDYDDDDYHPAGAWV